MKSQALKILAIIGARSGSKSVPDKNIRPLGGKPLMAWIIAAAKRSRYINRVIVSTDSAKYAEIARECGAEAPFLRPVEFAGDLSSDIEYIRHALSWLVTHEDYEPDIVLRLVPTSPLQATADIDAAIEKLLADPEADGAAVVTEARQLPQRALRLTPDGKGDSYLVSSVTGEGRGVTAQARQGYEKNYFLGDVMVCRLATIKKYDSLTGNRVRCHIVPEERAVDINSELDFLLAEAAVKKFIK